MQQFKKYSLRSLQNALVAGLILTGSAASAQVNVYVMSSGNATADAGVVSLLQSFGHTVTLGVEFFNFDGTQNLTGINTVYYQPTYNWASGDIPVAGQTALVNYVNSGGGLVTAEWSLWRMGSGGTSILSPLMAAVPTPNFDGGPTGVFTQGTPNAILNAGLPASFSVGLDNISGTETQITGVRPGGTVFYDVNGFFGVTGINAGAGRVLNFNTTNGINQNQDANFGRLLSNSMNWAAGVGNTGGGAAPEPGTLALVALGGLAAGIVVRRRKA